MEALFLSKIPETLFTEYKATSLEIRKRDFFSQRIITHWNKIPAKIKMSENTKFFKRENKKNI